MPPGPVRPAPKEADTAEASPLPVTYDAEQGRIYLLGEPAWFMSPEFYLDLQNQLEAMSGKAAKGILYRVSFSAGQRTGKRLSGPLKDGDDLVERLQQVSDFFSLTGHGRYTFEVKDAASAETGWVMAESFVAKLHAPGRESVCHVYAGFIAGWLTVLFDRPVECVEVECRSKGDPQCVFRTKAARATPI